MELFETKEVTQVSCGQEAQDFESKARLNFDLSLPSHSEVKIKEGKHSVP